MKKSMYVWSLIGINLLTIGTMILVPIQQRNAAPKFEITRIEGDDQLLEYHDIQIEYQEKSQSRMKKRLLLHDGKVSHEKIQFSHLPVSYLKKVPFWRRSQAFKGNKIAQSQDQVIFGNARQHGYSGTSESYEIASIDQNGNTWEQKIQLDSISSTSYYFFIGQIKNRHLYLLGIVKDFMNNTDTSYIRMELDLKTGEVLSKEEFLPAFAKEKSSNFTGGEPLLDSSRWVNLQFISADDSARTETMLYDISTDQYAILPSSNDEQHIYNVLAIGDDVVSIQTSRKGPKKEAITGIYLWNESNQSFQQLTRIDISTNEDDDIQVIDQHLWVYSGEELRIYDVKKEQLLYRGKITTQQELYRTRLIKSNEEM